MSTEQRDSAQTPSIQPAGAPPNPQSLGGRVARGTVLSILDVGGVQVLRLLGNLITTRLLFPEAYGLMMLVWVLTQGLYMISDVGILPNIIQHDRGGEQRFLDTAWTVNVLKGCLLSVLTLLLAWPYSKFYGQPELFGLVLFTALQSLIFGFDSTKIASLGRSIKLGRVVLVNLVVQVVTLIVMIAWAWAYRSVWSLIGGAAVGTVVRILLGHFALPGPLNRFAWDREAAGQIFHFGKWILLSTLATYLGMRFDALALGRLVDLETLGIYNVAQNLAALPTLLTSHVVLWVLLPALSEMFRSDREDFKRKVDESRKLINPIGVLMVGTTVVAAPGFFYLLYDHRYTDAGWMVQLLMASSWFYFLQETSIRVQVAMGDSRALMVANSVKVLGVIPGVLVGYQLGGIPGLILGSAAGTGLGYLVVVWGLRQKDIHILGADARWTLVLLLLCFAGGYLPWIIGPALDVPAQIASLWIGSLVILPFAAWASQHVLRMMGKQLPRRRSLLLAGSGLLVCSAAGLAVQLQIDVYAKAFAIAAPILFSAGVVALLGGWGTQTKVVAEG